MRSFWAISLLKLLPIRFNYYLGEKVSRYNRKHDGILAASEEDILSMKNYLWEKTKQGFDIALAGHVHLPLKESKGNKEIAILGDWIHHRTYGYMDEKGFKLLGMDI
jgi:UDP-2,3-diacylglucosamine pyrophosphatase LpxH